MHFPALHGHLAFVGIGQDVELHASRLEVPWRKGEVGEKPCLLRPYSYLWVSENQVIVVIGDYSAIGFNGLKEFLPGKWKDKPVFIRYHFRGQLTLIVASNHKISLKLDQDDQVVMVIDVLMEVRLV